MSTILQIHALHKGYHSKPVLQDISLEISSGSIFGLLGPNGSGKTTLLKIIAGLLHHYSGTVQVCGHSIGLETKKIVSFLPDRNCLYDSFSLAAMIQFYADFFNDFDSKKAFELLDFLQLDKTQTIKTMSKGMIEKMNLVLTFSRAAIKTWTEDSAIILSTHLVADIEHVFTDVAFLKEGSLVLQGDAEHLRVSREKSIYQLYFEIFG